MLKQFPIDDLETNTLTFVRSFYQQIYQGNRWIDKTPSSEAIHGIRLIKAVFPEAKIICTKRPGIETVQSRQQKFDEPFAASCLEWAAAMDCIKTYAIGDPAVLLIDQADLRSNPGFVAASITDHLDNPACNEALADFLARKKFEVSGAATEPVTLKETGWSCDDVKAFLDICGPAMTDHHYVF